MTTMFPLCHQDISREMIEMMNFVSTTRSPADYQFFLTDKTLNIIIPPILFKESLHSDDGTPVIEYADGFRVYANRGRWLPKDYGVFATTQYDPLWILSERNAQIRQILIDEIGWEKVCQTLPFAVYDRWREYELLFYFRQSLHPEPIQLLKMTCPSTGSIYIIRVPPNVNTAIEGVTWINHGIDPSSFAVET